jgi:hypothetical protein
MDAFLQKYNCIVRVLPMLVCLEGQISNSSDDLLLHGGSRRVARFRHGRDLIIDLKNMI